MLGGGVCRPRADLTILSHAQGALADLSRCKRLPGVAVNCALYGDRYRNWAGRAIKKRDLVRCGADMGRRVRMPPEVIIGICRLVMLLFPCGAATGFGGDFR